MPVLVKLLERRLRVMKLLSVVATVLLFGASVPLSAGAIMIQGEISFTGSFSPTGGSGLGSATGLTFSNPIGVESVTGHFAPLNGGEAFFSSITFNPITLPSVALWTASVSSGTYSFDLVDLSVEFQSSSFLLLSGAGTLHAPNLDATAGSWHLSANSGGASFSFSSDTSNTSQTGHMPEPTGAVLFGVGLAVVGSALRRKRRL